MSKYILLLLLCFSLSCGSEINEETSDGKGSCEARTSIPEPSNNSAQIKFSLPYESSPCRVSGYVVGYGQDLRLNYTKQNQYFIDKIPAGVHDVIISTLADETFNLGPQSKKNKGLRLGQLEFLNGIRKEQGDIELPLVGSIRGNAKLSGQTDHTGIKVYIPGTINNATTDSEGNYTITNIPVGTHNLFFESDGYHRAQIGELKIEPDSISTATDIEMVLSTGAGGFVKIADGAEIYDSKTVPLKIGATDDAVLMKISEDSTFVNTPWKPIISSTSYTFESEGRKTLYVKFANENGLESSPYSDSIEIQIYFHLNGMGSFFPMIVSNNKLILGGGYTQTGTGPSRHIYSIDLDTFKYNTSELLYGRSQLHAYSVQNEVLFLQGNEGDRSKIDIYNMSENNVYESSMSTTNVIREAGVVYGDTLVVVGGYCGGGNSNAVDIYNASSGTWNSTTISESKKCIGYGSMGSQAYFAGGNGYDGQTFYSNKVDIYDFNTKTWSTETLSQGRYSPSVATVDGSIYFIGGVSSDGTSNVIDVFDGSSWSTITMPFSGSWGRAFSHGSKIYLVASQSSSSENNNELEIFDTSDNSWSSLALPRNTSFRNPVIYHDGKIYSVGDDSIYIDVYDIDRDDWSILEANF